MEDVNMSQSAEQTAIGNVPPGGQAGVKRQVSADAFRALTMRLGGQKPSEPVPAPTPPTNFEAVAETPVVAPPIVAAPVAVETPVAVVPVFETPAVEIPIVETVVEPDLSMQPPAVNDLPDVAPEHLHLPEQIIEPQLEQPTQLADRDPLEVMLVTAGEIAHPVQPPQLPVEQTPPVQASETISDQLISPKAITHVLPPITVTKIILDPTPKPEPVEPVIAQVEIVKEQPVATPDVNPVLPEVDVFSGSTSLVDEPEKNILATPVEEPVSVTVDPLRAAMNLMNAVSSESPAKLVTDSPSMAVNVPNVEGPSVEGPSVEGPNIEDLVGKAEKTSPEIPQSVVSAEKLLAPQQPKVAQLPEPAQKSPVVVDATEQPVILEPDVESGETARELLDIMSSGSQPQERALASDTLLQLIPRMMVKDLIALAERVCMMEDAPPLLVKALINHHEPKVAGPLLEDGKVIHEQDLLRLIISTDVDRLIMIAKNRKVTQTICDALIARGEPSVYLTLVRNPGASLSHDAFVAFNEIAKSQSSLQAPLATRGDTPPPIAFELFWSLPVELRRYVLSRFLTDSATLDKILKITQSVDGGSAAEQKFPPSRKVEELVDLIADGLIDQAAIMMAKLAGANEDNARRIIADPDGEPLTVVFKTMGLTRAQFAQAIKKTANSSKSMLRSDRDLSELQVMFDLLSFNKARTLLTYWDWAVEKTGPYTRRVM